MPRLYAMFFALLLPALPAAAAGPVDKAAAGIAAAAAAAGGPVAVIPFRSPDGSISQLGGMLADRVTALLIKKGGITVLDRRYTRRVLGELRLGASGLTEGGPEAGRFTGARFLLMGSVAPSGGKYAITARLVEAESGRAAASVSAELAADARTRALYASVSALDSEAELSAGGLPDGVYFSTRTPAAGCRWVKAAASAPVEGNAALAKARALVSAKNSASAFGGLPGRPGLIAAWEFSGRAEGGAFIASLEACVKPSSAAAGGLKAELLLGRDSLKDGESAGAALTVSSASIVFLYLSDVSGQASLLWRGRLEAGRPMLLPGPGAELKAAAPAAGGCSSETLDMYAAAPGGAEPPAYGTLPSAEAALEAAGLPWSADHRPFSVCR